MGFIFMAKKTRTDVPKGCDLICYRMETSVRSRNLYNMECLWYFLMTLRCIYDLNLIITNISFFGDIDRNKPLDKSYNISNKSVVNISRM